MRHPPPPKTASREPTSEQEHLPAEQPSTGQDPRFPPADAHPGRSRHPGRAACQGSHPALGLTSVLPAVARLRRRDEFVATLRAGVRRPGGRAPALLVTHLAPAAPDDAVAAADPAGPPPARAGLVVSRAVGAAVVRNRVKRRLRHLLADRLALLPPGSRLVVRALPPAAAASSGQLAVALDDALTPRPGRRDVRE